MSREIVEKQEQQRKSLEEIFSISTKERAFSDSACKIVKLQRELFFYYVAVTMKPFDRETEIAEQKAFDVLYANILGANKHTCDACVEIESCLVDSRRVPGPLSEPEIQAASDIALHALLLRAERALVKVKEYSELIRCNLKLATESTLRVVK